MTDFFSTFLGGLSLEQAILVVLNLVLIESLLSVDNAAVLATMVMDLPLKDRKRALKYGIMGAYFFRGICLLLASWLVKVWWLKPVGGLYLLYLCFDYFKGKSTPQKEDDLLQKENHWFYKMTIGKVGLFWSTVILVEVMDLAFSIDNVFAAVAFTDNIYLICLGVFIGILAMRFVAQGFVKLMEVFPFLEQIAFLVIGLLGLKLSIAVLPHIGIDYAWLQFFETEKGDLFVSVLTVALFVLPILSSFVFGFPKRNK